MATASIPAGRKDRPAKLREADEVVGEVKRVRYRDEDTGFVVVELISGMTVVGEDPEHELHAGSAYRFLGRWDAEGRWGRRLKFDVFALDVPNYEASVVAYLVDNAPGVGTVRATKLFRAFGKDAVAVLRTDAARAAEACGLTVDDAAAAADALNAKTADEDAKIDLYRLTAGRGFPRKLSARMIRREGKAAPQSLQRDPFRLATIYRQPLKKVDRLYLDFGHDPGAMKRQCLWAVQGAFGWDGSTWVPRDQCEDAIYKACGKAEETINPGRAIEVAQRAGMLAECKIDGASFIASGPRARAESRLATRVKRLSEGGSEWPAVETVESLSPHQAEEVAKALAGPVGLLLGTPGCLAGETIIRINRGGKGFAVRIDRLVTQQNGEWAGWGRRWDLSIPTMVARAHNGRVRLCHLKDAWASGMKETFTLRTVNGRSIRATADHPFLMDDGTFVRLGDLRTGYALQVDAGKGGNGRVKNLYRDRNTMFHPYQRPVNCGRFRHPEHRLVVEAEMNGLAIEDFLAILRTDAERSATLKYLPPRTIVHHKDRNHLNNSPSNLMVMEKQGEHAAEHAEECTNNVLSRIGIDRVFSIEKFGEEPTYDIEVEDDPHCFMANGFAVHNTGKTYTTALVVKALIAKHGANSTAVVAPTGKAAVRCTSAMHAAGVNVTATTIHKMLCYRPADDDGEGRFDFSRDKPLECRFIVVDEASMLDVDICAALMDACGPGTHVLFVGDPNQLPPVGHGAPLRDFRDGGLPCGLLTEIRRNAGLIVTGCSRIKDGLPPKYADKLDAENGMNLRLIEARSAPDSIERLASIMEKLRDNHKADASKPHPVWGIQVLVASNTRSEIARKPINDMLQGLLNANGGSIHGNPFRTCDKVICLRNGQYAAVELEGKDPCVTNADDWVYVRDEYDSQTGRAPRLNSYVANGEIGDCVAIGNSTAVFKFEAPERFVKIPIGRAQSQDDDEDGDRGRGCNFDLAYAVTCHKSQGSQWPVVVVLVDEGAGMICDRCWHYTAISRAEKICLVIGKPEVLEKQIRRQSLRSRVTRLAEMLKASE